MRHTPSAGRCGNGSGIALGTPETRRISVEGNDGDSMSLPLCESLPREACPAVADFSRGSAVAQSFAVVIPLSFFLDFVEVILLDQYP